MARLLSVNVGLPFDVTWRGKSATATSISADRQPS